MSSLRNRLQSLQSRMAEISDEIEAIGQTAQDENRDLNDDETKLLDELGTEFDGLVEKESTLKSNIASLEKVRALKAPEPQGMVPQIASGTKLAVAVASHDRSKYFNSSEEAYAMGRWLFGLCGHQSSRQWSIQNGFDYRNDQSVGDDPSGGYTVPKPLMATIIRLLEEYGIFRRFARNVPMSAMTLDVPKRSSGLTVRYPGEGQEILRSDIVTEQVNLIAKKYACLNVMSSELAEDAIISWTDLVAREIAWAIALAEDTNSFLGDGSATDGGISGIQSALLAGSKKTVAAGSVTLSDLEDLAGSLANYAGISPAWYMSRYMYFTVVLNLLNQAGGTDMRQVEAGGELMLMGAPVRITNVLPGQTVGAGDLYIVYGDLQMGAMLGVRRQLNIRLLTELFAVTDQIGIIATSRSDTAIHETGDATDAGAIVGLFNA